MTQTTQPTASIRIARAILRGRIIHATTKRFVANAQRALPRDGTATVRSLRKFVAQMARHARRNRSDQRVKDQATPWLTAALVPLLCAPLAPPAWALAPSFNVSPLLVQKSPAVRDPAQRPPALEACENEEPKRGCREGERGAERDPESWVTE